MAFVDMLGKLLKDKELGKWIVPIIPDEARTFGMDPFFASTAFTPTSASSTSRWTPVSGGGVPRGEGRPDPGRGHHRGRLDVVVHRRRHRLRHPRRADDPVLHLLFDVRLPAHRRPDLGRRRHADARLPARRHRRPHHAERRGPAAPGRPQPRPRLDGAEPVCYDPAFAYELAVIVQDGIRRMYEQVEDDSSTTSRCTTKIIRCRRCRRARPTAS